MLLSIKSKKGTVVVVSKIHICTCEKLELESYSTPTATVGTHGNKSPLLIAGQLNNDLGTCMLWEEEGFILYLSHGKATR